jgi:hypothetical protein
VINYQCEAELHFALFVLDGSNVEAGGLRSKQQGVGLLNSKLTEVGNRSG